jgi:hypothetical protein
LTFDSNASRTSAGAFCTASTIRAASSSVRADSSIEANTISASSEDRVATVSGSVARSTASAEDRRGGAGSATTSVVVADSVVGVIVVGAFSVLVGAVMTAVVAGVGETVEERVAVGGLLIAWSAVLVGLTVLLGSWGDVVVASIVVEVVEVELVVEVVLLVLVVVAVVVVVGIVVEVLVVVVGGTASTVNASGGTMVQSALSASSCHMSIAHVPPPFS